MIAIVPTDVPKRHATLFDTCSRVLAVRTKSLGGDCLRPVVQHTTDALTRRLFLVAGVVGFGHTPL